MTLAFRFRPCGVGRYAEAAFLGVWLLGWLAGEAFALALLAAGTWALLAGTPLAGTTPAASPGPSLAVGSVLLVWLAFWSLGGVLALRQLLRCLWADDQIRLEQGVLLVQRRLGPFRRQWRLEAATLRRVWVQAGGGALALGPLLAERADGPVTLTDLGTPQQRVEAAAALRAALALPDRLGPGPAAAARLPGGWECLEPSFGSPLLVWERRLRRRQGALMAVVALPLAAALALTVHQAPANPALWPLALVLLPLAMAAAWASLWLLAGRLEWRLEARRLVLQRRFGPRLRPLGEVRALQLREDFDGDGDAWYSLVGCGGGGRPLLRVLGDPTAPRALGQWLAHRTGIALEDALPSDAERQAQRQRDLAQLRQQLAGAGRWGQLALRLLEAAERRGR